MIVDSNHPSVPVLLAAENRILSLVMRQDLDIHTQESHKEVYWMIKDPVTLKYVRLDDRDYALLCMFDGTATLASLKARFAERFPGTQISFLTIQHFASRACREGLLLVDQLGYGQLLHTRNDDEVGQITRRLMSCLFPRFCLFDPDRMLRALHRHVSRIFSGWLILICVLLFLTAISLVTIQFQEFNARLPSLQELFGPDQWLTLCLVLLCVKLLHEFGHGLVCKHFGGECHEIGFMFLGFTPCLYCDVSESALFPNKWHRIATGAAGILVDLTFASLATFLWWFTTEGVFNSVCMKIMIIGSLGTLIFNANPLLRFDGYYILSDLVEIPNLFARSRSVFLGALQRYCLGKDSPIDETIPLSWRRALGVYAVAAMCYRFFVLFALIWFVHEFLKPSGFGFLAYLLATVFLCVYALPPLQYLMRLISTPCLASTVKVYRLLISSAIGIAIILGGMFVPVPTYVYCDAEISSSQISPVCVSASGGIGNTYVKPGDIVSKGDRILGLYNDQIEFNRDELKGRIQLLQTAVDCTNPARKRKDDEVEHILQKVHLASFKKQWEQKGKEFQQLTISAPTAGQILAPEYRHPSRSQKRRLPKWSGIPLENRNNGAYLQTGTVVCYILGRDSLEVILWISDADHILVRPGQRVTVRLDPFADRTWSGTIDKISEHPVQQTLASKQSSEYAILGSPNPSESRSLYQATLRLHEENTGLSGTYYGAQGSARIEVSSQSLGHKAIRCIRQTLNRVL